jgi:UDP-N-acetylmuramate--alanine ligase
VSSAALAEDVERFGHRHVEYIGALAGAATKLKEVAQPGDLVLTLGAGNVYQAGDEFLRMLEVEHRSSGDEEPRSRGAEGQRSAGEV